jgi:hypothetical protein
VRWNLKEWTRERPQAKSRTDEQKPHIRQYRADEPASQGEFQYYPNLDAVNAAVTWDEGYSLLPGEVLHIPCMATDGVSRRIRTYAVMYS